jgi:hypothetical protein
MKEELKEQAVRSKVLALVSTLLITGSILFSALQLIYPENF